MKTISFALLGAACACIISSQAQNQLSFEASNITSGFSITDMKIADVNNDSRPDVVWTSGATGGAGVHLANASGGFQTLQSFSGVSRGKFLAVLDYNNDGYKDIFISSSPTDSNNPSYIAVVKGSSGGFTAPLGFTMSASGERILQAAEITGDGIDDLVAAEYKNNLIGAGSSRILVFGIPGNGTILNPVVYPLTAPPTDFIMSDINGDGKKDVVACSFQTSQAIVMINTGTGLAPAQYMNVCSNPIGVCTGDFNKDGHTDIVIGNSSGVYTVLLGDGAGQFNSHGNSNMNDTSDYPAAADFDGDGNTDLAFGSDEFTPGYGIEVAMGDGNGIFTTRGTLDYSGVSQKIHIMDVNGDGKPDIIGAASNNLIYLKNTTTTVSTTSLRDIDNFSEIKIKVTGNTYRIGCTKTCSFELYDVTGKKIMNFPNGRDFEFTSEGLPEGFYLCRFTSSDGVQRKKIHIQ